MDKNYYMFYLMEAFLVSRTERKNYWYGSLVQGYTENRLYGLEIEELRSIWK